MPLRKPCPHDHKDTANHRKLQAHVQEVVDLLVFNKLAVKMEAKAMRAVASTFSEDALTVWTSCVTEAREMTTSGAWQPSALLLALTSRLVTYNKNQNAHYQMESDLAAMVLDLKGVGPSKVTWDKLIREYYACVTGTSHLDLPVQVPRFTWKEGWFSVFKSRVQKWALKVIMDKPSDFNTTTITSFWMTLLRYYPRKTIPTCLHALTESDETIPWKEAALQALHDGDLRLAQLCLQAEGQEDEIPCTTPSYIHAMAQGAPLMARNGKPIECWTCGGNHLCSELPQDY